MDRTVTQIRILDCILRAQYFAKGLRYNHLMDNESTELDLSRAGISLPKFKNWKIKNAYDFENEIIDYESIDELNRSINQARLALFKTTESISKYEQLERLSKVEYERAHRRELLKSTAKTADERRARADLMTEDLENTWIEQSQLKEELIRLSYTLRLELQTLQALGNNLRQQMRVI